jgi:hypothetical protein
VVRAEHLPDFIDDVGVQPADGRAHYDDRGHADDDADQGKESTQFVREDGGQSDPRGINVKGINVSHTTGMIRRV